MNIDLFPLTSYIEHTLNTTTRTLQVLDFEPRQSEASQRPETTGSDVTLPQTHSSNLFNRSFWSLVMLWVVIHKVRSIGATETPELCNSWSSDTVPPEETGYKIATSSGLATNTSHHDRTYDIQHSRHSLSWWDFSLLFSVNLMGTQLFTGGVIIALYVFTPDTIEYESSSSLSLSGVSFMQAIIYFSHCVHDSIYMKGTVSGVQF